MLKFREMCVNLHGILESKPIFMKHITTIYLFLAMLLAMVSCQGTTDNTVTLYDDAIITSFAVISIDCYVDGEKTTYSGSGYKFNIDPICHQIYNTDSLPMGTDIEHIRCTLTTMNNGMAWVVSKDGEMMTYFSATDTIDFSTPRIFRIYPSRGQGYTEYTVKVNVHQEDGDDMKWTRMTEESFPTDPTLPADLKKYLGKSTSEEYALSTNDRIMVKKKGQTAWEEDFIGEGCDYALIPTQDVSLVSYPLLYSDSTDYVLMAGTSLNNDKRAMVWRKIVDYSQFSYLNQWILIEREDNDKYNLPLLTNLNLIYYDDGILAFGGDYKTVYKSRDNGITWKPYAFIMPYDFKYEGLEKVIVKTDDDFFIWMYCDYGTSKEIWRGRMNKMAWEY